MSRLFDPPLAIDMETDSLGRPVRFALHGRRHKLARALEHWEVNVDWWKVEGRVHRQYWALTTTKGMLCVVYRDLEEGEWFLVKVYD
jgi:hypothetical protein